MLQEIEELEGKFYAINALLKDCIISGHVNINTKDLELQVNYNRLIIIRCLDKNFNRKICDINKLEINS